MLDLIALFCLLSFPLLIVVAIISFIAAFISLLVKDSEVKIVKNHNDNI